MGSNYRILNLDIENFPAMGYAWSARTKYPTREHLISVVRQPNIACFGWKWEGDRGKARVLSLPMMGKRFYKQNPFDDTRLLGPLWELLTEAHLLVGHNVGRFDLRKIIGRMILMGLGPPSPVQVFDTLIQYRKHADLPDYSLNALCKALGVGQKTPHKGFPMWEGCMDQDPACWEKMELYGGHDVDLTQECYHIIRPWSKSHPNVLLLDNLPKDGPPRCPYCGYKTEYRGDAPAKTYVSKRYHCLNPKRRKDGRPFCGHWSQGERRKVQFQVLTP